jgi:hypothetical protein
MKKNSQGRTLKLAKETLKNLEPSVLFKLKGGVCMTSFAATTCPNCVTP